MSDPRLIGRDNCFFCELPKDNVIAACDGALLIKRTTPDGQVVDNMFHVIPAQHITNMRLLPPGCTSTAWKLMDALFAKSEYEHLRTMPLTRYTSHGYDAGQRAEHPHEWWWFRTDSTQLGPYGIFLEWQELTRVARPPELVDMAGTH